MAARRSARRRREARAAGGRRPAAWVAAGAAAMLAAGALLFQQVRASRPEFDGARAFAHLERQVAFGPRVPNTAGHRACRDWLVETLKPLAASVERQDFRFVAGGTRLEMSNIVARFTGKRPNGGVLLCAHWDTRPTADYEDTPAKKMQPIPGANDGASGVAVLLEAARILRAAPPPVPVMLVFFDGEDYGPGTDRMFLGARHFAANLPADVPRRGILLDMIGDRDLQVPQEANSVARARAVVDEVYEAARRAGEERAFPRRPGPAIDDDHIPLLDAGLQVIDLIDFDYGPGHSWWHTLADTPDKCSPASLRSTGKVVLEWLYSR